MKILEIAVPVPINKIFSYLPPQNVEAIDIVGKRVKVPFGSRNLTSYVVGIVDYKGSSDFKLKEISEIIDSEPIIFPEAIELAKYISQNYVCSVGEALASIIPPQMKAPKRTPKTPPPYEIAYQKHLLNPDQQNAVDLITQSISSPDPLAQRSFLIHGVTGSGKTEVYLNCIDFAIKNQKNAIMLIPEISLTAQFVEVVTKRFGQIVGVWHSQISNIDKYKLFHKALSG
ncbi:MAG: DEAD/DEAH box helicase family protein, partial [Elusimicrobiota bacterium]|nr:DEAD/DEAH box helicase family protein [Elusimicrobiota bacterium]